MIALQQVGHSHALIIATRRAMNKKHCWPLAFHAIFNRAQRSINHTAICLQPFQSRPFPASILVDEADCRSRGESKSCNCKYASYFHEMILLPLDLKCLYVVVS